MPLSERQKMKKLCDQAINDIDRYCYNLGSMHKRLEDSEKEFESKVGRSGMEHLSQYAPDYADQKSFLLQLTALAVKQQELTEQFKSEYI